MAGNFSVLRMNILVSSEGGMYTAQALQYDITAQGETLEQVMERFERTLVAHIMMDLEESRKPLDGVPQAPPDSWEKWKKGRAIEGTTPMRLPSLLPQNNISIPEPWMIDAMSAEIRVY